MLWSRDGGIILKIQAYLLTPLEMLCTMVFVTFLWGSPFPFIKKSYEQLHIAPHELGEQILFAGYRFFFASIFLIIFLLITKQQLLPKRSALSAIIKIGSVQTFLQYFCLYIGLNLSSGITSSIIIGSTPFMFNTSFRCSFFSTITSRSIIFKSFGRSFFGDD